MDNNNNNKTTPVLDFIEKHKSFIKKIIVFVIAYIVMVLINNPAITNLFNEMFGEYITMAIKSVPMTFLITSEV